MDSTYLAYLCSVQGHPVAGSSTGGNTDAPTVWASVCSRCHADLTMSA